MKPHARSIQNFNILVQEDEEGFVAYCPELSLTTDKQPTEEEARKMLKQGIAMMMAVSEADDPQRAAKAGQKIEANLRKAKGRKTKARAENDVPRWIM